MRYIIVSLTYIFLWETHTHTHIGRTIYYSSYVLDLFQAAPYSAQPAAGYGVSVLMQS